jgi:hypothetical protein
MVRNHRRQEVLIANGGLLPNPEEKGYVQLAADDASFATGNIYGSGGGKGQP